MGGDEPAGLVITPELGGFGSRKRRAIDNDPVGRTNFDRGCCQQLAVHGDAAVGDPAFGIAPRAQSRARHRFGNTHRLERATRRVVGIGTGGCRRRAGFGSDRSWIARAVAFGPVAVGTSFAFVRRTVLPVAVKPLARSPVAVAIFLAIIAI